MSKKVVITAVIEVDLSRKSEFDGDDSHVIIREVNEVLADVHEVARIADIKHSVTKEGMTINQISSFKIEMRKHDN